MLSLYKALIRRRRESDLLLVGTLRLLGARGGVLAYARELGGRQMLIALNMTDRQQVFQAHRLVCNVLLSTYLDEALTGFSGYLAISNCRFCCFCFSYLSHYVRHDMQ